MSNPTLVPLADYQRARLTEALAGLAWSGYHPDLVDHTRRVWGATEAETAAVLTTLGVPRGT